MPRETEYRSDQRPPDYNWFTRSSLFTIELAGIGYLAYTMGGPHGKILDKLKNMRAEKESVSSYEKWIRKNTDVKTISDFQGKVPTGLPGKQSIIKSSSIPSTDELIEWGKKEFGTDALTPSATINEARRLENDIQSFFDGDSAGHSIDSLKKLDIYKGHSFAKVSGQSELSTEVITTKLKLEVLKEHASTQNKYREGAPPIDINDPIFSEDPFANRKKINELHRFTMENDKLYADKYIDSVKKVLRTYRMDVTPTVMSDPTIKSKIIDGKIIQSSRLTKKTFGSVEDQVKAMGGIVKISADKSSELYKNDTSISMSRHIVEQNLQKNIDALGLKKDYARYMPQMKKLVNELERLKTSNPDRISEVFLKDFKYGTDKKYMSIGIRVNVDNAKPYLIELPIPIAQNGLSPNIRGIQSASYAETKYVTGQAFRMSDAHAINSTQNYFEQVYKMMNDVRSHGIIEQNPKKFESDMLNQLYALQSQGTPLYGEHRDVLRSKQIKMIYNEQFVNTTPARRKSRLETLKLGVQTVKIMRDIKQGFKSGKKYNVVSFDLETINLDAKGVQYTSTDPNTGIWQCGIVQHKPNGEIREMEKAVSDHIFRENRLFIDELKLKGTLKTVLNSNTNEGNRVKGFANFTKKITGLKDDYDSLIAFMNDVKSQAAVSRQTSFKNKTSINSSVDFANYIKARLEDIISESNKRGEEVIFSTSNGLNFDLTLLETLTGGSGSIRNKAANVDVQKYTKAMTTGMYDAPSMSLNNLLMYWMQKSNKSSNNIISFDKDPQGFMKTLSHNKHISLLPSKRTTVLEYLKGKSGKRAIAHDALSDSVALTGLFSMLMNFHDEEDFYLLRDLDAFVSKMSSYRPEDNLKNMIELQGATLPDNLGEFTFSTTSANGAAKMIGSNFDAANMYPILASNPPGRNLSQIGRTTWIRKDSINTKNRDWMTRNKLNEHQVLRTDEIMHRRATWTQNRLVSRMQFHTAYMIDKWGGNQGLNLITKDALEFKTNIPKLIPLRDIPDNAVIANGLTDMYSRVLTEATKIANDQGINFDVNGGETSANIYNQAAKKVRAEMEKFGSFPSLDPNNPITMTTNEGGKTRTFNNRYPGKIVELVANAKPGEKSGPISYYAQVILEASGEHLNTAVLNDSGTNALVHLLNVKSTSIPYKKAGLMHPIQRWSSFDFLSKGMWGSLRQSMLMKGWQIAQDIIYRNSRTEGKGAESVRNAKEFLKKMSDILKESIGYDQNKDGTLTIGSKTAKMSAEEALKAQAKISVIDILEGSSMLGHEATFTKKQMEAWYGYHGKDMWEGRTKIRKDMANMLIGLRTQKHEIQKATGQVGMVRQQAELVRCLDPMQKIERDLRIGKLTKSFWNKNPAQTGRYAETARAPIFMQIAPDPNDPMGYGRPMYVAPEETTIYVRPWDIPNYKKDIKLRRSYYDQIMLKGNHFSDSTKQMLENTIGWKKYPKLFEVSKKYNELRDGITNMLIAKEFSSDHELTYDQISQLIERQDTKNAIERDLASLNEGHNPEALNKVSKSMDTIKKNIHEFGEEELEQSVEDGISLMNLGKKEFLEEIKNRQNWLHTSEINESYSKLSHEKGGLWFLPGQFKTKHGKVGKRFDVNLDNMIHEINSSHTSKEPIKKEALLSYFKLIQEGDIYKGAKSTESMLSIKKVGNKHVVSMAGFLLPANAYAENIAHEVRGGYGIKTDMTKAVDDVLDVYHIYQKETLKGRQAEGKWHEAAKQYIMFLEHAMSPVKGSPIFDANNTVTPKGFEMTYHSVDHALDKANGILRQLESGKHGSELKEFFGKNTKWTPGRLQTHLTSMTDMKLNTMFATKSSIFHGDMMMQFANGSVTGLMDEVAKSERLKKEVKKISSGRETLPGAVFVRYPLAPEGSIPGHEGPLFVTPDEIGKMVGIDKNKIYGIEGVGNMLKADNDNDKGYIILKGFSSIEDMDNLRQEQRGVLNKYKTFTEMQSFYDNFNKSQWPNSIFERGGEKYARVPRLDYNNTGGIVLDEIKVKDIPLYYPDMPKIKMGGLVGKNMTYAAQLGNSSKALQRHIQTNALGAYSKTQIGLWNNTITQRFHEVFMGNPGLAKNSTEVFSLLGSLDHGLGNLIQEAAIAPVKHGDINMAYRMTEMYKVWNDPGRASQEAYKRSKDWWVKQAEGQPAEIREKAGLDFDFIMNRSMILDKAKKYDPNLARQIKQEHGHMLGKSGFTFMDWAMYSMFDKGKVDRNLSDVMQAAWASTQPGTHGEQLNVFSDLINDKYLKNSLESIVDKKFKNPITNIKFPMKQGGKIAAIGAMAYLGLNFFRPNSLSNSSSPLDMFVSLGTDVEGENNIYNSDLELPRHLPLDITDASFSKQAFITMNDNKAGYKKSQSNYLNSVIENSTLGGYFQSNTYQFRSMSNTTYSNRKTNIGSFGNSNLERQSKMF